MNILHVNMSLDPVTGGGTVERILQLHTSMRGLDEISSRILSLAVGESPALLKSEDVILLPCWNQRWYLPAPKLLMMFRLVQWADVIHLMNHWTILNIIIYWIARITSTPYVICPAGALPLFGRSHKIKRWYNRLAGRFMVKNATAAIAIAADESDILQQYGTRRESIHHIPNGIRANDFICVDQQLFRNHAGIGSAEYLLYVGRLNEIKGPDLLLDAFTELASIFFELHLVFVGPDGGMRDSLEDEAEKAGVADRVHFVGYAGGSMKSSAYHGAELLAVPSRQEAMSIVALEGAVCGIPVVMTDRCGFDALSEIGAAKLAKADAASLAEAMQMLLADAKLRREMGAKGRKFALEHYTWDIAAVRHAEIFRQIVPRQEILKS